MKEAYSGPSILAQHTLLARHKGLKDYGRLPIVLVLV